MARKKIVFVIVEGPTDNDALGLVFEHFFKEKEVYVHIVHGDITTRAGINNANILKAVVEEIKGSYTLFPRHIFLYRELM